MLFCSATKNQGFQFPVSNTNWYFIFQVFKYPTRKWPFQVYFKKSSVWSPYAQSWRRQLYLGLMSCYLLGPTLVVNNNVEVAQLLPQISRLFCPKCWSNYFLYWFDLFQKISKGTLRLQEDLWKIWKSVNKTLIS